MDDESAADVLLRRVLDDVVMNKRCGLLESCKLMQICVDDAVIS